ncbi:MAG: Lrp/AsnC family transcriptional regulator [Gammaproteobacteria bacterium]|nr:Lrp/AsnC family transcriptional regulator [Gammaproteobacteria bacterium]
MKLTAVDRTLINQLQGGFPLTEHPWDELAEKLSIPAEDMIERIRLMQANGLISRFGPIYNAERMGGGLTLAAVKVEPERFAEVNDIINSFDQVAHNYERDHELNMWFVIATESPEEIQVVIDKIEAQTGLDVYNMPKQEEYFLELKLMV